MHVVASVSAAVGGTFLKLVFGILLIFASNTATLVAFGLLLRELDTKMGICFGCISFLIGRIFLKDFMCEYTHSPFKHSIISPNLSATNGTIYEEKCVLTCISAPIGGMFLRNNIWDTTRII